MQINSCEVAKPRYFSVLTTVFVIFVFKFFGSPISSWLTTNLIKMGKGDKKTKRGKIVNGTYGRRRQPAKKRKKQLEATTKTDEKS